MSWFAQKQEEWKGRSLMDDQPITAPLPEELPTKIPGENMSYPEELRYDYTPSRRNKDDFSHLGPIGYTSNTWRSRDDGIKDIQNLMVGFHIKKSIMLEMTRRMILAESKGGLPKDIDKDSLCK